MGKAKIARGFVAVMWLGALGCGDDGDSGGRPSCAQLCARIEAPECPRAAPDCEQACRDDMTRTPASCDDELDELSSCFGHATFTCDADGVPKADACKAQLSAWTSCLANAPHNGGDGDDPKPGDGDGDDPKPGDGGDGSAGVCSAQPDDNACDSCIKGSCCAEATACGAACQQLVACLNACTDEACLQTCLDSHSEGAQAFQTLSSCVNTSCATSCNDQSSEPPTDACLPGDAPEGYCDGTGLPVAHDCPGGQPFDNCVLSPTGAANVYCCDQ